RGAQRGRPAAFLRGQVPVARAHRDTVRHAQRTPRYDTRRKSQVRDHMLEQDQLLIVLAPEYETLRRNDVEQPAYHGSHAVEVSRPAYAAQIPAQLRHHEAHRPLCSEGVYLSLVRHEQRVDRAGVLELD